jgi:putative flippase GtrA
MNQGTREVESREELALLRLPVLLIPAYQPDARLIGMVQEIQATGRMRAVVVVDDGSGAGFSGIFAETELPGGVHLLRHLVNLGKGAALKHGLNYIACSFPESVGVVTADADGQHALEDILAVGVALTENPVALVLGTRRFDKDVPFRSKFGNEATRRVLRLMIGQDIADTQTGLRGIPMEFVPALLNSTTTRYDFELDMLLICRAGGRRMIEIPIRTIYLDGNKSSHFNPLIDSMRVYFVFLRFASVSLLTAFLDNVVFFAAYSAWPKILACQLLSRVVSGTFNFQINKRGVFHSHTPTRIAAPRYALTAAITGAIGYLAISNLVRATGINVLVAKVTVETSLFIFSFVIQRAFVFKPGSARKSQRE